MTSDLEIVIEIDENPIYEFSPTINEASIVASASEIERILKSNHVNPAKLQDIYEITIELMQNILNYSYGHSTSEDNKKQATGKISLSYWSKEDVYIISTTNLIALNTQDKIKSKIAEVAGLDNKALRKLTREKMRHRDDKHERGAGLGFIVMARKSSKPIEYNIKAIDEQVGDFTITLVI